MQNDVISLGPGPVLEDCAQVGSPDYQDRALRECRAYIEAIRKVLGPEPEGARLRVNRNAHDFGTYYDCVVEYDGENEAAARYAQRCDAEAPTTWEAAGLEPPVSRGRGRG